MGTLENQTTTHNKNYCPGGENNSSSNHNNNHNNPNDQLQRHKDDFQNRHETSSTNNLPSGSSSYSLVAFTVSLAVAFFWLQNSNNNSNNNNTGWMTIHQFLAWYMIQLEVQHPVLTKSITTGLIQWLGDGLAQWYDAGFVFVAAKKYYDKRRGISLLTDGLVLSGPLLHYCFEWLEWYLPIMEEDTLDDDKMTSNIDNNNLSIARMTKRALYALLHVLANDYLIDTFYLFVSFGFVAYAEGQANTWKGMQQLYLADFWTTLKASWTTSIVLIPIEFICFRFLTVRFRVLAMNMVDVLWGAIISFVTHQSWGSHHHDHEPIEPTKKQ